MNSKEHLVAEAERLYIHEFMPVEGIANRLNLNRKTVLQWKEKYGWEFIFIGANIDATKEAARFGIREDRAANYHADSVGTAVIYEAMSEGVCNVRANRPMNADWKKNVDADYKKRGK